MVASFVVRQQNAIKHVSLHRNYFVGRKSVLHLKCICDLIRKHDR